MKASENGQISFELERAITTIWEKGIWALRLNTWFSIISSTAFLSETKSDDNEDEDGVVMAFQMHWEWVVSSGNECMVIFSWILLTFVKSLKATSFSDSMFLFYLLGRNKWLELHWIQQADNVKSVWEYQHDRIHLVCPLREASKERASARYKIVAWSVRALD